MNPTRSRWPIVAGTSAPPPLEYDGRGPFHAIAIGPESDYDSCFVFPVKEVDPALTHSASNSPHRHQIENLSPKGFKVSVERPFVGLCEGPLIILPKYSKLQAAGSRSWPQPPDNRWPADPGGSAPPNPQPFLELALYTDPVLWLPTERAPYEAVDLRIAAAGAGIGNNPIDLPGWGRRRIKLCLSMFSRGAGTLTWSLIGGTAWGARPATGDESNTHEHTLGSGVEAADFNRTYLYEGMFDYYILSLSDAGAALDDDTKVSFVFEAYDR